MAGGQRSQVASHGRSFIEGTVLSLGIWPVKTGGLSWEVAGKAGLTVYASNGIFLYKKI